MLFRFDRTNVGETIVVSSKDLHTACTSIFEDVTKDDPQVVKLESSWYSTFTIEGKQGKLTLELTYRRFLDTSLHPNFKIIKVYDIEVIPENKPTYFYEE